MRAEFEVALGQGRAGASLAFDRAHGEPVAGQPWLPALAALLTLPFTVALAAVAISNAVGSPGVSGPHGAGALGLGRVIAFGPVAALLLFAIARIRVHAGRQDGRWVGRVSARLNAWELTLSLIALAVVAVFFGHLVADSWACANGVKSAC
jgi:hypothetical protein